jgi:peroxiredoxin Q/BCP
MAIKKKKTTKKKKTVSKKVSPKKSNKKKTKKLVSKKKSKKSVKKSPAKKLPAAKKSKITKSPAQSPEKHSLVGQTLPSLTLQSNTGESHQIQNLGKDSKICVLYFYPKDDTPGCTKEACDFRDNLGRLTQKNITVIGVSPDPTNSHNKFIEKYSLNFPLLSDENHALADALGVWKQKSFMGRSYMGIERTTFVIKDGKILGGWQPVSVEGHVDAIFQFIEKLG